MLRVCVRELDLFTLGVRSIKWSNCLRNCLAIIMLEYISDKPADFTKYLLKRNEDAYPHKVL